MDSLPDQIAYIGRLMFQRKLTDIAGGNVSAREGDTIYCTPRYTGQKLHWNLTPEDIVIGQISKNDLLKNPSFSREGASHLSVYRVFSEASAIIHAHPQHVLPFCAIEKPIEPLINSCQQYGTIQFIDHTPAYSQAQADSIVAHLRAKKDLMQKAAAAVLMPQHGIFIVGKDLWSAIDALERININAWCIISQKLLSQ